MVWGQELWDAYDRVAARLTANTTTLTSTYAKLLRDKAEVEAEYARGLRRLVARYSPGPSSQDQDTSAETEMVTRVLEEVGYIAGQHEVVADCINTELCKEVQSKSVEYLSKIKTNIKSYKKEKEKLKTTLFDLEKSKLKYLKSFHDWEESDASYQAAEKDGTLARNEIQRIKLESETRHKHYVAQTEAYQQQLKVTNTRQSDHYRVLVPDLLDTLEGVERARLELVRRVLGRCVETEREVTVIVTKCHADMGAAVASMEVEGDINLMVDINKSGDLPPGDIPFTQTQQLREKKAKASSLSRRLTMSGLGSKTSTKQNLFQKKRRLLKTIEKTKAEFEKGSKEVAALQLMVATYKERPEYGSAARFEQELRLAEEKVRQKDEDLSGLSRQLDLVESAMCLTLRHSVLSQQTDYSGDPVDSDDTDPGTDTADSGYSEFSCAAEEGGDTAGDRTHAGSGDTRPQLLALYSYDGAEAGSLAMEAGDTFTVLEADSEGWTRVARQGQQQEEEEGFVPTSFTSPITVLNI